MDYQNVNSLVWADKDSTMINCKVTFTSMIGMEIPFTASPKDPEAHGREIYERAINGEFGPIAEYVEPIPPVKNT
jgi:hypothetical protein